MAALLCQIRRLNKLGSTAIAEPFAGGAGASLTLLFLEETADIYINDLDKAIYSFWQTLVQEPKCFLRMLSRTRVSMAEWYRQRETYRKNRRVSLPRRGFSAFYLNRCNRSGIIMNGGPVGGIKQKGEWKLGARFNKVELRQRIEKIAEFKERIHVSGLDGISFIGSFKNSYPFFFIDPPYYAKGKTLYLNSLDNNYHRLLGEHLRSMTEANWILTYDDCSEIRRIYRGWANIRPFTLRYAASERRSGKEILIAPKHLRLPSAQPSAAIDW